MVVKDTELPPLRRRVEPAAEAPRAGDGPFGSVLVGGDGTVLGEDHNRVASGDRTRPRVRARALGGRPSDTRGAGGGDGVHLRRALPDVRGPARLGGPRAARYRSWWHRCARCTSGFTAGTPETGPAPPKMQRRAPRA